MRSTATRAPSAKPCAAPSRPAASASNSSQATTAWHPRPSRPRSAEPPPAMESTVLQAEGLGFAHPGEPALLTGFGAVIGTGVTQLHGDTGSGKTTLLRLFAGILHGSGRLTL